MDARRRCVVLGLDGLSLELARQLCALTPLPALASLVHDGRAATVEAELPELSPVNWTSFFTAAGPEDHGVFGFTRIGIADYAISLADFSQVTLPTLFDRLGSRGLVSRVVNLPHTYPARPIPGILVAGFVAPELTRAVHPRALAGLLAARGYRLEADTERGRHDHDFLLADLAATLDSRRMALELFWPDLAWDLFVLVLTETDRLFHFLLPAVLDPGHARHTACLALLRHWDGLVGEVLERYAALPEPKRLMVLADHGFACTRSEVDVNAWLRDHGFLRLTGEARGELDSGRIHPDSLALALDPGRIYVNSRTRFAQGRVAEGNVARILADIRDGLSALTFEGQEVMERIYDAHELYPGPMRPLAPDLVCLARPGFDLKAKFDRAEVFGLYGRGGCHTAHGALWWDSQGARPARLRHTGAEVLAWFGLGAEGAAPWPLISSAT